MKPYAPPPPPGAQPPPLWGSEDHARSLLGDRVTDVSATKGAVKITQFPEVGDFRVYFMRVDGPTIATHKFIAEDPERVAALDRELDDIDERFSSDGVTEWEYLLLTARKHD